ncbi:RNA-binding domain-containing protein [Parapedobacter sp. GCM10030251]|uniref:RNA-binding domain-containing protein n=1 Tax=Parapedobacter sp. GCM10030251 TaxID=3273419 RepID=UPI00361D93AC
MDERLFEELIRRPEGYILDFKETSYQFGGRNEDEKFIKDLISFSNTIRQQSAYIIAGIREGDNQTELIGIAHFADDAIFQQKAKDKIWPKPVFSTYKFPYQGKLFGIVEIPIHPHVNPLTPTRQLKGLEPGVIYLRRNSSNSEAAGSEIIAISDWLRSLTLNSPGTAALQAEISELIIGLSDQGNKLSAMLSRSLQLARKIGNTELTAFIENELMGYNGNSNADKFGFRVLNTPATPYKISIPSFGNYSADKMIAYMEEREEFRNINYFFPHSIIDIESMMQKFSTDNQAIASYEFPYKTIFPEVTSNIGNATIYIGPQSIHNLYANIRKYAIKLLIESQVM